MFREQRGKEKPNCLLRNQKKFNLFIGINLRALFGHRSGAFICTGQASKLIGIEAAGLCWFEMQYFQKKK